MSTFGNVSNISNYKSINIHFGALIQHQGKQNTRICFWQHMSTENKMNVWSSSKKVAWLRFGAEVTALHVHTIQSLQPAQ